MNRREFLERMFACGLVAATPKIIFDMGANARTNEQLFGQEPSFSGEWKWGDGDALIKLNPEYVDAEYEEILIPSAVGKVLDKYRYSVNVVTNQYSRRFDSNLKEIFPYKLQ